MGGGVGGLANGLRHSQGSEELQKRDQWKCPADSSLNFLERATCRRCGAARPAQPVIVTTTVRAPIPLPGGGGAPAPAAVGEWMCKCQTLNFASRASCRQCFLPRPASAVLTPSSPGSMVRAGMRGSSGGWGREDVQPSPPAPAAVADAADEIQRVDKQLTELEEEVAQLRMRRAQEASRKPGIVAPKVLVETIYRENHVRTGFVPTLAPAVSLPDGQVQAPESAYLDPVLDSVLTLMQPQDYPCFQDTAKKHEVLGSAIKAEIRKRKLRAYYRMRMVGERNAKLVEPLEDSQTGGQHKTLLRPGGVMRLQEMASSTHAGTQRWDSNLAREVDMEWNRDHLRYVFDDQSQRVLDPERENAERRAALRWTEEEQKAFVEAYKDYGKEFHVIATKKPFRVSEVAPKTTHEIIAFYYFVKHRINLKQLASKRGMRRERAAMSTSATPIPRELLNLGITSEADVVAYLMAKSKGSEGGVAAVASAAMPVVSTPSSLSDVQVKLEPGPAEKRLRSDESSKSESVHRSSGGGVQISAVAALAAANAAAVAGAAAASVVGAASNDFLMPDIVLEEGFDAAAHATQWSSLESDIFLEAVVEYGPDWVLLAKDTGKSPQQCAAFYVQNLSLVRQALQESTGQIKVEPNQWTDEDKVAYRQFVMENGRDWTRLSATLHKSEDQCHALWRHFKVRLGLVEALKIFEQEEESRPSKTIKLEDSPADADAAAATGAAAPAAPAASSEPSAAELMSPPLSNRPLLAETQEAGFFITKE